MASELGSQSIRVNPFRQVCANTLFICTHLCYILLGLQNDCGIFGQETELEAKRVNSNPLGRLDAQKSFVELLADSLLMPIHSAPVAS